MLTIVNILLTFSIMAILSVVSTRAEATDSSDGKNSILLDKMSWNCANNASCLYSVVNSVLSSYKQGEVISFGLFDVEKLKNTKAPSSGTSSGRSLGFADFLSGNSFKVPIGPMVFSVQRSGDEGDFLEISISKPSLNEARRHGGLGGGMGGNRIRNRHGHKDKKQFQMFIPIYLAATTFGWTMLAVKAVGILTLKALAISKLAFIVAAMVIIKKLMDNASEKLMYPHYPEQQPFIMPYNMDYGMHALQGPELGSPEMYPLHYAAAAAAAAGGGTGGGHQHQGMENVAAESNLHQLLDVQNGTQILAGLAKQMGHQQKIKRADTWMGAAKPFLYNYLPTRSMYNVKQ
ncbi:uncharacterized protein LOC129940451 [Eupeodes corollae]|uniref:uncharacterized protein LOC129940451 n=1 Tax=Eupeodes corollae TaxID=290404 RepID=UPI002492C4F1|nr:uncharacterized protein LOC129940451 [Eupeodes corollae]